MDFIQRGGIAIPREYENEMWYREIRADLLRRAKKFNTPDFEILKFYLESKYGLTIPRFYPITKFLSRDRYTLIDKRHEGEEISIEHNITPRNKIQKMAIHHMLNNESAIMELQPGVGKTVISIYVIATRKRKTFILVHRDSLVEQWIDRITQFTNLKLSDISRLSTKTLLTDLSSPIIIATNQTMLSILKRHRLSFLLTLNNANIGIFLADEIHTTVGAPTFSECSIHMPCKYIYGLSATPYRWDGNSDIIEYHLGEIFCEEDDEGTMAAEVTVIGLDYQIDIPYRHGYLYWDDVFQRSRYLGLMRKSINLLNLFKIIIPKLRGEDRQLVIMSERKNLIEVLFKEFNDGNTAIFTAGHKLEVLNKRTTLTTPGKMRDGVDAPWKDTLIMTSPISNIAQVCGRVTRSKEGKKYPVVVDLVDLSCEPIRKTFYARLKYYEKRNWNIRYISYLHNRVEILEKEYFLTLLKS